MKDAIAQDVIDNFHINYFDTSTTLVKYTQKLNSLSSAYYHFI